MEHDGWAQHTGGADAATREGSTCMAETPRSVIRLLPRRVPSRHLAVVWLTKASTPHSLIYIICAQVLQLCSYDSI